MVANRHSIPAKALDEQLVFHCRLARVLGPHPGVWKFYGEILTHFFIFNEIVKSEHIKILYRNKMVFWLQDIL